jgi:DNA polymerase III subunit epsilon
VLVDEQRRERGRAYRYTEGTSLRACAHIALRTGLSTGVQLPSALRRHVAIPPTARRASFTAIDFETATRDPNSACAIGLVRVEDGRIVRRAYHLIRPPSEAFEFTYLHGIDWVTVRDAPTFAHLWPRLVGFFENIDFAVAHNAEFDAGVLRASCGRYGLPFPAVPFECTVRLARASWNVRPTTLRHVADFLGLSLDHHNAASDAEACANIVLRSARS